jgi:hypothetical protein
LAIRLLFIRPVEDKAMKTMFLGLILAAGSLVAAPRVAVSIGVGVPVAPVGVYAVAPAPVVVAAPPCPGPGYAWTAGGWYFAGGRRVWRPGYWAAPARFGYYRGYAYGHGYVRFRR